MVSSSPETDPELTRSWRRLRSIVARWKSASADVNWAASRFFFLAAEHLGAESKVVSLVTFDPARGAAKVGFGLRKRSLASVGSMTTRMSPFLTACVSFTRTSAIVPVTEEVTWATSAAV